MYAQAITRASKDFCDGSEVLSLFQGSLPDAVRHVPGYRLVIEGSALLRNDAERRGHTVRLRLGQPRGGQDAVVRKGRGRPGPPAIVPSTSTPPGGRTGPQAPVVAHQITVTPSSFKSPGGSPDQQGSRSSVRRSARPGRAPCGGAPARKPGPARAQGAGKLEGVRVQKLPRPREAAAPRMRSGHSSRGTPYA
jgi:hypothetical protein